MNNNNHIIRFICSATLAAVLSCGTFISCSTYDDTELKESIKDIQNRLTELEKKVSQNIAAIQSMISTGSIASFDYDANTGKMTIKLLNGQSVTIDNTDAGTSLVTVIEKDGKYFWGICRNGETTPLEINGEPVPVSVTPSFKLSDEGEWLISADGSAWTSTGIFDGGNNSDPIFFKEVRMDGDYLYLTLADDTVIKVAVVGEAEFSASETSVWFTGLSEEKLVPLKMTNVKAYTITEKPEGWKAQIAEENLIITSPADISSAAVSGEIKVLAVFESGSTPEILCIEVGYEPALQLEADSFGAIKVTVSEHVADDYPGYLIYAWNSKDYSAESAAAWLNSTGHSSAPYADTRYFVIADLMAEYSQDETYAVFAVPYIPSALISSGDRSYSAEDILSVECKPAAVGLNVTDTGFDRANVIAAFTDVPEYYAGICTTDDWNNFIRDNFIEQLSFGGVTPYTASSYVGPADAFPDGEKSITMLPDTEYTLWFLPKGGSDIYKADDFMVRNFTTTSVYHDSSVAAPEYETTDVTYGGFSARVTPAAGTYKTYAAILPAASIPSEEAELITTLMKSGTASTGTDVLDVSTNKFDSDAEVYIIAVSIKEDGGYGAILKDRVMLKSLEFTDETGITACEVIYGICDVTLKLTFKGNPSTITYMAASYNYYSDEMTHKMMAMSQFGDVIDKQVSKLDNGNEILLTGLKLDTEYTFYAVVKDADGTPSHLFTKKFIPTSNIDYVTKSAENYTYGMPQLSGEWNGPRTYTLNVDKPSTCRKFWLFNGDSEYFTGDIWIDSDRLVSMELYGVEVYEDSITEKKYTTMHDASRFYIVWLDDKGEYHAIYEFDPHK